MIGRIFKGVFYSYVFILALYVTYRVILGGSYGGHTVEYEAFQKKCVTEAEDWRYCQFTGAKTDKSTVLYVLHGKGQEAEFWERPIGYSALLHKYWEYTEERVPMIVTVSFGKKWLLTDPNPKNKTYTIERFKSEVIPAVEEVVGVPRRRFLMGESMGALNAISLLLGAPQMFDRIVALCPPLYNISPFDSWKKMIHFTFQSGASPKNLLEVVAMGRLYFPSNEEWLEFSPVEKVKRAKFSPKQQFYLSAGLNDEFGAYEGTLSFLNGLRKTSIITHWKPHSGGHCAVDVESLGRFLKF